MKFRLYFIAKLVAVLGMVSMIYTSTLYAQDLSKIDPAKINQTVVDLADKNPLLSIIYIEGVVTIAAMALAFFQMKSQYSEIKTLNIMGFKKKSG